jgi:KDO2-lipid IV(A) lauroyltransferase
MRLVVAVVGLLPYRWLRPLGALVGALAGGGLRIRRHHVIDAMVRAGIERPARAASAMYASLGRGLFELLWMAGRPAAAPGELFALGEGAEVRLAEALSTGRGVLVATAHTGNWDMNACAAAAWLGARAGPRRVLHVVTKRLSWRALDRLWQRLRAERGVMLVDARGAARSVLKALRAGDVVAMMIDQVPERPSGVVTFPFLGQPARHDLAPVTLAARAGAPIVVAFGRRAEDGRHVLEVVDVIAPEALRGPGAVTAATARIAGALEAFVRAHPAQWLWMHRRWKGVSAGGQGSDDRDQNVPNAPNAGIG